MAKNIESALDQVELTYSEVIEIANQMLESILTPINDLISVIGEDINSLSLDQLKDLMWKLQYKAYVLSEVKEKSSLKAEFILPSWLCLLKAIGDSFKNFISINRRYKLYL